MASIFSLFSSLIGGGKQDKKASAAKEHVQEIEGFKVVVAPLREGGQFRIAGRIESQDGERTLVRHFIRADVFTSEDDAIEASFRKAAQVISQSGKTLFADGEAEGRA